MFITVRTLEGSEALLESIEIDGSPVSRSMTTSGRSDARRLAVYFFAKSGMSNCLAFKEKMQANPDMAFDLVMREEA